MNPYQNNTDEQLLTRLAEGNTEAFEVIYSRYADELFQYIQRNISPREDCEEILQDVFEWIWTRHKTLRIVALKPYLFSMARYSIIKYFRRDKAKKNYERHFQLFEAVYDYLHEEEESIDPDTLHSFLETSLDKLPERCKAAFKLRLYENLSNTEIAERMNIKKDTVENYMVKALSHLRESYQDIFKTG